MDRFTCHMPANPLWFPSRTGFYFFSSLVCVTVYLAVHSSSQSYPMDISSSDWRWGKLFYLFSFVVNKGLKFSSSLWVACMRLPSGRSTLGPLVILNLFLHGVLTLM